MKGNTGFRRVFLAAGYSLKGLRAAFVYEAAFRQEIAIAIILIPLAFLLDTNAIQRVLLVSSTLVVLIVELLNSAIEVVVDRIGPEFNELSGRAKDIGSAAVMISLLLTVFVWGEVLWSIYF